MTSKSAVFRAALAVFGLLCAGTSRAQEAGFDIYFIDVQGGAATLLVTPERESILIDTGWPGLADRDPKRIAHVIKDVAGLDHLDHLVTTHWHTDHYGGVEGLSKLVPVRKFWDRGLPDLSKSDGDRAAFPDGPKAHDPLGVAYRRVSEGKRQALKAGDRFPIKGVVEATVLASGGEVVGGDPTPENPACASSPADQAVDGSDNARSLALRFRLGEFAFLDCGDLTWNVEKKLVCPVDRVGPIDLYQVTHHGMAISNHPTLLKTVAPRVAVMNNGPRKGGDPKAVRLLKSIPSIKAAYQLHKNSSGDAADNTEAALIANTSADGGQFIHARVKADGSSFTVRIGEDGTPREFATK